MKTSGGMRRTRAVLLTAIGGAVALAMSASMTPGCGYFKGKDATAQTQPAAPPAPVLAADVVQQSVAVQIRSFGNVEAYSSVSIKSEVTGMLTGLHFKEGDFVKTGQLLASIDPNSYRASVDQAQANLARDVVQANHAAVELRRQDELVKKGAATQDEYDNAKATNDALHAAIQADQAMIESAQILLNRCQISSPIDGRLGGLQINLGNLIKPNDVPIAVVNQIQPIFVSFTVPQQYLATIRQHMADRTLDVYARLPMEPNTPERGKLTFVDNNIDLATGTIRLKGTFPNADMRLWPGQFVNVVLDLTVQDNAIVVPSQAVQTGQKGTYVFVIKDDMTVQEQLVSPGRQMDSLTVIDKGLRAGQRVVTDGQLRLIDGARVVIRKGLLDGAGEASATQPAVAEGSR